MSTERYKLQTGFSSITRIGIISVMRPWLIREFGVKKTQELTAVNVFGMNDKELLTYYTAFRISPSRHNKDYKNPERIHNLLAFNLMQSVFGRKIPEFSDQETKQIIKRAFWMARLRWQAIEDDPNQLEYKRAYATQVIADIDMRLDLVDSPSPPA